MLSRAGWEEQGGVGEARGGIRFCPGPPGLMPAQELHHIIMAVLCRADQRIVAKLIHHVHVGSSVNEHQAHSLH